MNLTDLERKTIAKNRLQTFIGYDGLPSETRNVLIEVFRVGMIEMEHLDTNERIMEAKIEINNLLADG